MEKFEPTIGQDVFLADGRKAIFAGVIDDQIFVRIIYSNDSEYGHDEWPADKLTPVGAVYASEPVEVYGPKTVEVQGRLTELKAEAEAARANVLDLQKQANAYEAATARYPDLATAIDFMEGRITHVTLENGYSAPEIKTLEEMLRSESDYGRFEGMRLLCLFGTDDKGKRCHWRVNHYRDGSGSSWTVVTPHHSLEAAEQYLRDRFALELGLWRAGEKATKVHAFRNAKIALEWPEDYLADAREKLATNADEAVAKLEAQIAVAKAQSGALSWASLAIPEQLPS